MKFSPLAIITLHEVIIARYATIPDQPECTRLYNQQNKSIIITSILLIAIFFIRFVELQESKCLHCNSR